MNTILGILIFSKRRDEFANKLYVVNIACVVWWSVMIVIYRDIHTHLLPWALWLYTTPTFIGSTFLYFSFFFPEEHPRIPFHQLYKWAIILCNIGVFVITLIPGNIIVSIDDNLPGSEKIIHFGPWYPLYALYIGVFFGLGLIILARKLFLLQDKTKKRQLEYLLWGYLIASTLAMFTNLTLPYLNIFAFQWLGQVLTVFMVLPVTYAIFKHRLFDVKVITAELMTVTLWMFLLGRLLLDTDAHGFLLDGALFLVVLVIGLLLIRSVDKEVEQRERIEKLSTEKSEFMTFASHEIRNPITAMRGYASLMVDGTAGEIPPQAKDAAEKILVIGDTVLALISQFLNQSKLELGQIAYNISTVDLGKAVASMAEGFEPHARQKDLTFATHIDYQNLQVQADEAKLREVVGNLIDNSIKYTKEGGVTATVEKRNGMARVVIADTGVGIPQETIPYLFQKFSRTDAQKMNLFGTGLGLYLAKTFIEGMGGKIWAESEGKDKGSRFIIEFHVA
ncbi:MAG: hypothetical protein KGH79_04820 [Patescibacteria group bacterium]|nr:hypothetical protein [Patescibacteria group bacterium]